MLTSEELVIIKTAIDNNDENEMLRIKKHYEVAGCDCKIKRLITDYYIKQIQIYENGKK